MKTTAIRPIRLPMRAPDDLAGFAQILDGGTINAADIVGLWCKTRGNGLRNDFTQTGDAPLSGHDARPAFGL
ncbi:MAG: hypothetical protein IBJ15_16090 [Alphaproteobacteria bacterium]|nr:hypothetical protein [Alphaproteobacteria bacterium]